MSIPASACETYGELRGGGFSTFGLDIFLKRGMLEWLFALAASPVAVARRDSVPINLETAHSEMIALMTNMMEAMKYGI